MPASDEKVEKIVILPVCWDVDAINRLCRIVDLDKLRRQRKTLQFGLKEDVRALAIAVAAHKGLALPVSANTGDAVTRQDLDTLLELLQTIVVALDRLD